MKAFYYEKYGSPEVIKEGELADPKPKRNQVLIKVAAFGLNPLDYRIRRGELRLITSFHFPLKLSSDVSGEVIGLGSGVKSFKKGDKVYGMASQPFNGTSAEQVAISHKALGKIPHALDVVTAASVPLAAQTSLQALRDLGRLKNGQRVLINGASGGTGIFAVQIAKILGAVVTGVTSFRNTDWVKALGADAVIDYTKSDFCEATNLYDLVYDCYGNHALERVKNCLKPKGVYVSS